jgi:hypothetical protein
VLKMQESVPQGVKEWRRRGRRRMGGNLVVKG